MIEPGEVPLQVQLRHRVARIDFAICQYPDRVDVIVVIVFINNLPQNQIGNAGFGLQVQWFVATRAGQFPTHSFGAVSLYQTDHRVGYRPGECDAGQHSVAPNDCTTTVTVMALKPLHDAAKVKRVIASSYQAVSGAGTQAIEELKQQVLAWAKGEQAETKVFPHPIAFNLIPQVDVFEQSGYTKEEMKLVHETRKLLGDMTIKITATTVRVPVWYAHSVSVTAETERKVTVGEARDLFTKFPGLHLWDDPPKGQYPTPLMAAGKDECYVGRVREDLSSETGLNFWVVGDQLRKGAALNAIQIAELILGVTKQGDGSCTTSS